MKQRIHRLSTHHNGVVLGSISAVMTLVFIVPILLIFMVAAPESGQSGEAPPFLLIVVLPIAYFVMGYLMGVLGCFFYNLLFANKGGFEFELRGQE
ncbi:MAG: hypothetical protein LC632_00645 [Xanthomonadaceae bacterium]|nr:hypothetical protein [Xanthomonadaceae bacterium]